MILRKKVNEANTVYANYHETGITAGTYNQKGPGNDLVSVENAGNGKLRMLVNQQMCSALGIEIVLCKTTEEFNNVPQIED